MNEKSVEERSRIETIDSLLDRLNGAIHGLKVIALKIKGQSEETCDAEKKPREELCLAGLLEKTPGRLDNSIEELRKIAEDITESLFK